MDHVTRGRFLPVLLLFATLAGGTSSGYAVAPRSAAQDAVAEARSALAEMARYDYGDSRAPLSRLRVAVRASLGAEETRRAIEGELIEFLASEATFAGKQFVAEQLSLVASAASVPSLARLLAGAGTADIAIFALQRIPDAAADEALLRSLPEVGSTVGVGIVNALGARRASGAVEALEALARGADPALSLAAVVALGKIGGDGAIAALETVLEQASGSIRRAALDAYLRCADGLLADGIGNRAAHIYESLYRDEDVTPIRAAALRGLVFTDTAAAPGVLLAALRRDNQQLQTVAAGLVRELPAGLDLDAIIAELPNLSSLTQVQLLSALGARGETGAYAAVLAGMSHYDAEVRSAAISALIKLGSEADVDRLAMGATSALDEGDRVAARATLDAMPSASVTREIMNRVPTARPEMRAELVRSLGQRRATAATELLLGTAVDPDRSVRLESFKSLALVAGPEHVAALIDRVVGEANEGVRNEAERTLVLVAQKHEDAAARAAPVLAALPSVVPGPGRRSLIEVLGRIGDTSALPAIQAELGSVRREDRLAAIQALSTWPDAGPRDELLSFVNKAGDEVERILALRGYIDLLRIPTDRPAAESVSLFLGAMDLATEASEQRMVLSGLGRVPSHLALRAVVPYLENATLRPEAEAACSEIVAAIMSAQDTQMREMLAAGVVADLERILALAQDERLRDRAAAMLATVRGIDDPDAAGSGPTAINEQDDGRVRVLILDGVNNHDWASTTASTRATLEQTGRFVVDVSTSPPKGASRQEWEAWSPRFADYAVVLSNFNDNCGNDGGCESLWSEVTKSDLEAYVRGGGAMVSVHAADNHDANWLEYNRMIGVGGWGGRQAGVHGSLLRMVDGGWTATSPDEGLSGAHGSQREFLVVHDRPDHPILAGLPAEWMHARDELYASLRGPAENVEVLAHAFSLLTGENEPILMLIRYGEGTVFHVTMGHYSDETEPAGASLACVGFQTILARGTEYVATGKVTIGTPDSFPGPDAAVVTAPEALVW